MIDGAAMGWGRRPCGVGVSSSVQAEQVLTTYLLPRSRCPEAPRHPAVSWEVGCLPDDRTRNMAAPTEESPGAPVQAARIPGLSLGEGQPPNSASRAVSARTTPQDRRPALEGSKGEVGSAGRPGEAVWHRDGEFWPSDHRSCNGRYFASSTRGTDSRPYCRTARSP
jgi:hypothetical protein